MRDLLRKIFRIRRSTDQSDVEGAATEDETKTLGDKLIPGDFEANKARGQAILQEAKLTLHAWTRMRPKLIEQGIGAGASLLELGGVFLLSKHFLGAPSAALFTLSQYLQQPNVDIKHTVEDFLSDPEAVKMMASQIAMDPELKNHPYFQRQPELHNQFVSIMAGNGATDLVKLNLINTAMKEVIGTPLKTILQALAEPPKGTQAEGLVMKSAVEILEKEAKTVIANYPESSQKAILGNIATLKDYVKDAEAEGAYIPSGEWLRGQYDKIILQLSAPIKKINTYQHNVGGDKDQAQTIDQAQEDTIKGFADQVKDPLDELMNDKRFHDLHGHGQPPAAVLLGPGSVGKTWSMRKMAKALGAELMSVTPEMLCEFLGVRIEGIGASTVVSFDTPWEERIPELWRRLLKDANDQNIILFCDEFKPSDYPKLLPAIKRWLTGDEPLLPLTQKNAAAPKMTFVIASNDSEEIKEFLATDPAFASRLKVIEYPHWTHTQLMQRADEYINEYLDFLSGIRPDEPAVEPTSEDEPPPKHESASIDYARAEINEIKESLLNEIGRHPEGTILLRELHGILKKTINKLIINRDKNLPPLDRDEILKKLISEVDVCAEKKRKEQAEKGKGKIDKWVEKYGKGNRLFDPKKEPDNAPPPQENIVPQVEALKAARKRQAETQVVDDAAPPPPPKKPKSRVQVYIDEFATMDAHSISEKHNGRITDVVDRDAVARGGLGLLVKRTEEGDLYFKTPEHEEEPTFNRVPKGVLPFDVVTEDVALESPAPSSTMLSPAVVELGNPLPKEVKQRIEAQKHIEDLAVFGSAHFDNSENYAVKSIGDLKAIAKSPLGPFIGKGDDGALYFMATEPKQKTTFNKIPASVLPFDVTTNINERLVTPLGPSIPSRGTSAAQQSVPPPQEAIYLEPGKAATDEFNAAVKQHLNSRNPGLGRRTGHTGR
ncbi:MAG TPA: hypothetical protein VM532_01520 [Burkholderiales bacterium]|nr:hypothetical protein [Burkholderiales bacterium]